MEKYTVRIEGGAIIQMTLAADSNEQAEDMATRFVIRLLEKALNVVGAIFKVCNITAVVRDCVKDEDEEE